MPGNHLNITKLWHLIPAHLSFFHNFSDTDNAYIHTSLQWLHNERDGVSNHQRLYCLHNRLSRRRSKKTSKLCVNGLREGNPPVTEWFPHKGSVCKSQSYQSVELGSRMARCRFDTKLLSEPLSAYLKSGSAFIKPDQLDPWIKDQIKITLLPTISHLQLLNFVSCGRACPSHMTQNLVTVGAKLWTAERFLVDPWSIDYADPVW